MSIIRLFLFFLFASLILAAPGLSAQTKEPCSPGFIWDGKKCVSCVRPCDTGLKGACGRGLTNCKSGVPVCEVMTKPGDRMEVCNGEDDDCDGQVDEGFDKDKDGYATCGGDCDDRNPAIHPDAVEKCDGIDNDCNGIVDDGFDIGSTCTAGRGACAEKGKRQCSPDGSGVMCTAVAGNPRVEICDGIDNDCDGIVDNGLGEIICGVGSCRQAVPACKDGKANKCNPLKPAPELCGDSVDNDCDGHVDEDFEALGKLCRVGVGVCERTGTSVCSEDKLSLVCNAAPGQPQTEICGNRYDDDCNGMVDDAAGLNQPCDNGQSGECHREGKTVCDTRKGEVVCSAAKVEPRTEKCDGLDNDCDGEIDEGAKNACGTCGALPASIGERCKIAGSDICGAGVWECDKDKPGSLICAPHFDLSENLACPGDDNPCTKDFCHEGVCTHMPVNDGVRCDDSDSCTLADHCVSGMCKGGGLQACDDGNSCTIDRCDPDAGCVHDPVGGGRRNECGSCELQIAAAGDPCNVPSANGVCAKGEYRCTPERDLACVQTVFGSNEICNGEDDDCNGVVDDGLGETSCGVGACKVTVANCANGKIQNCVPLQPRIETCQNIGSDDDCNGIIDDVQAGCGNEGVPKGEGLAFDRAKTRAAMLPYVEVHDSAVTSSDLKYAWIVVSGSGANKSGIAAIPVREVFEKGHISFRSCELPNADPLKRLTMAGADEIFAASGNFYYRISNLSSLFSSGDEGACSLNADAVLTDESRPWSFTARFTDNTCKVQGITSVASLKEGPVAGTVVCARGGNSGLGIDIISLMPGSVEHRFVPLWESKTPIESAVVLPMTIAEGRNGFAIVALVDGKTQLALCREIKGEWSCMRSSAADIKRPLTLLSKYGTGAPMLISDDDSIFKLSLEKDNLAIMQTGETLGQLILPESITDDVVSGVGMSFASPHALTAFIGKEFGGPDLFAAYDIKEGARQLGTMGFFYWNKNEPPRGTITGVTFDGKKGVAKLNFTDPDGDPLKFSAHIMARHGGSLDHWIERVDEKEVRFSAKGEAASSVGVWPIKLTIEVTDTGGAGITVIASIANDGTIEAMQEVAK